MEAKKGALNALIEQTNTEIDAHIVQLRQSTNIEELQDLTGKLNNTLFKAIYHFPHIVNGVEIMFQNNVDAHAEEWGKQYGHEYAIGRRVWEKLAQENQEMYASLVFPLPFAFSTGTHGSGSRAATTASSVDIFFTNIGWEKKPVLAFQLLAYQDNPAYVELSEIKHVILSSRSDFAPSVGYNQEILPKQNSILHYLNFRQFSHVPLIRQEEFPSEYTNEDMLLIQHSLLLPGASNLWQTWVKRHFFRTKQYIRDGFLIVYGKTGTVTMYEIADLFSSHIDHRDQQLTIARELWYQNKKTWNATTTYKGHAIIDRLVQIPVEERVF